MFYGKIFLRKVLNLADLKVDTYMSYTTNLFELELVSLTHYHSAEIFFQLKLYHSNFIKLFSLKKDCSYVIAREEEVTSLSSLC